MENYIFTSESITEGHPDKICDLIADTILDEALKIDCESKMAVEATIKDDFILIYGEANTKAKLDYEKIAKKTIKEIGYQENYEVKVNKQSPEITVAVTHQGNTCAGDQGIIFGYACNDTIELLPMPIYYANKLAKKLSEVRKKNSAVLLPDGKTQVSVEYKNNKPYRISSIIIACQHISEISKSELYKYILENVIKSTIDEKFLDENTNIMVNTSGSFTVGGSFGDSGTTGRKIVCDSYGGMGRIGGGCFSSKNPTKVDRSAAYYCRYVAKSIVGNNLADKCEIQVAYTIGKENPISLFLDTFSTNKISEDEIYRVINENFDFRVGNIIDELDLKQPKYSSTCCYGQFGNLNSTWEKIKEIVKKGL